MHWTNLKNVGLICSDFNFDSHPFHLGLIVLPVCSRSPSTFCCSKLSVGRHSINLALYLPLGGGDDQGGDAGDQISFISIAATNRSFWPNFKCRRGPPRLVFLGPSFRYDLAWYLAVTCWVGIFDFLQSVTCETPYWTRLLRKTLWNIRFIRRRTMIWKGFYHQSGTGCHTYAAVWSPH